MEQTEILPFNFFVAVLFYRMRFGMDDYVIVLFCFNKPNEERKKKRGSLIDQ